MAPSICFDGLNWRFTNVSRSLLCTRLFPFPNWARLNLDKLSPKQRLSVSSFCHGLELKAHLDDDDSFVKQKLSFSVQALGFSLFVPYLLLYAILFRPLTFALPASALMFKYSRHVSLSGVGGRISRKRQAFGEKADIFFSLSKLEFPFHSRIRDKCCVIMFHSL